MKLSTLAAFALLAPSAACGSSSAPATGPAGKPQLDGAAMAGDDASTPNDGSAMTDDAESSSEASRARDAALPVSTVVMPRISAGVPAFSSGNSGRPPSAAADGDMTTSWSPDKLPGWIAYDLSGVPVAERHSILVVWNAPHAASYLNTTAPSGGQMPTDYTIEINSAPGGTSAPPATGWVKVVTVSKNLRDTVEHSLDLNGGNWVRMSITGASDANVAIDVDVFSTPNGATDAWMLMGDSITYITMDYAFSDVPQLVHAAKSARWPAVINAAIGGTSTMTAVSVIDDTMNGFPGRFVALNYGTNDLPNQFEMETLVQHVIAAGKIPVVPHMPWSAQSNIQTNGPILNKAIDALYVKYPQIVPGPDLWAAFLNRSDLIPAGDVHPNSAGQEFLRQQWAKTMAAIP